MKGADAVDDDDNNLFQIGSDGVLRFVASPDYENPQDANGDNLYELTVIATDPNGKTTSIDVTVKVTNDPLDDDLNADGTVEIFNRQPEVGTRLYVTGNPKDADGGVRSVKWQWYWQTTTDDTCAILAGANFMAAEHDPDRNADSSWEKIDGAIRDNYTPDG